MPVLSVVVVMEPWMSGYDQVVSVRVGGEQDASGQRGDGLGDGAGGVHDDVGVVAGVSESVAGDGGGSGDGFGAFDDAVEDVAFVLNTGRWCRGVGGVGGEVPVGGVVEELLAGEGGGVAVGVVGDGAGVVIERCHR